MSRRNPHSVVGCFVAASAVALLSKLSRTLPSLRAAVTIKLKTCWGGQDGGGGSVAMFKAKMEQRAHTMPSPSCGFSTGTSGMLSEFTEKV